GSVYAFKSELNAWRESRAEAPQDALPAPEPEASAPVAASPTPAKPGWWVPAFAAGAVIVVAAPGLLPKGVYDSYSRTSGTLSSVAVLPFLDLSPQKDQEYFSDGLTEEIIDALSRVPGLRVAARTSAFAFKGKPADIRQIGQQLNVVA